MLPFLLGWSLLISFRRERPFGSNDRALYGHFLEGCIAESVAVLLPFNVLFRLFCLVLSSLPFFGLLLLLLLLLVSV